MIPVADDNPSRRRPVVTYTLIVANILVFLYQWLLGERVDAFIQTWGAVPAYITDPGAHPLASLTLISSIFLHGGWAHLIGNMLYLWIFGDNVEDRLGRVGYLAFYLVAGLVAGLAQVLPDPASTIPGVGASGAIAGVLGVYLLLYPTAPVRVMVPGLYMLRLARVPALIVLGFWFVLQLFNGVLSLGSGVAAMGGVAWFAHIGGFVAGLLVGAVALVFSGRQRR
jgi:membrane associated rhomboid family serine protease